MAPRKATNNRNKKEIPLTAENITLEKALCPICRCILIRPVTLPCAHNFCEPCFEGTVENAILTCPLCRVRFGSWHRKAIKYGTVVNDELWKLVKEKFSLKVENRLNNIEEDIEPDLPVIHLSKAGEIHEEYERERKQVELERQRIIEEEETASAELIKQLKEQEEYEALLREEKLKADEELARQIAQKLQKDSENSRKKFTKRKPLDKYLLNTEECSKPVPVYLNSINKGKSTISVDLADSNDSIENEYHHFQPIDNRNVPPSKPINIVKVPAKLKKTTNAILEPPSGSKNFTYSPVSAFALFCPPPSPILGSSPSIIANKKFVGSRKRKQAILECEVSPTRNNRRRNDFSPKKQPTTTEPSPKKSRRTVAFPVLSCPNAKRLKQEQEDLEFARRLQEEFNKERYLTRSTNQCGYKSKKNRRQLTLTEILAPQCK